MPFKRLDKNTELQDPNLNPQSHSNIREQQIFTQLLLILANLQNWEAVHSGNNGHFPVITSSEPWNWQHKLVSGWELLKWEISLKPQSNVRQA